MSYSCTLLGLPELPEMPVDDEQVIGVVDGDPRGVLGLRVDLTDVGAGSGEVRDVPADFCVPFSAT